MKELSQMSDSELSECFAVEVAKEEPSFYLIKRGLYYRPLAHGYTTDTREAGKFNTSYAIDEVKACSGEVSLQPVPATSFATSSDAVLPWAAHYEAWTHDTISPSEIAEVTVRINSIRLSPSKIISGFGWVARAPTFARAACIALIKAHRATLATPPAKRRNQ